MGNSLQTSPRKLKHTLPFLHNYRKIPSSPTRPLLESQEDDDSVAGMWSTKQTEDLMKKSGEIEKDIRTLKSNLSKLESRILSSFTAEKVKKEEGETAMTMREMNRRVANLEHNKGIEKRNTATVIAMEKKISELEATVHGLKTMSSTERRVSSEGIVDRRLSAAPMDDLIGVLLVLIFLLSILIGINL